MGDKETMLELLRFINSKNSHVRSLLKCKLEELGLKESNFYREVANGNTNIGKNQIKFLLLFCLIDNLD